MKGGSWEAEGKKVWEVGERSMESGRPWPPPFPLPLTPKGSQLFLHFFFNPKIKNCMHLYWSLGLHWNLTLSSFKPTSIKAFKQDEKFKIIKGNQTRSKTRGKWKRKKGKQSFQRKRPRHKFGFVCLFFFLCVQSQNAVSLQCMHRMNPRAYGLEQWLPSWAIPSLMFTKEIQWLLHSIYIQSHTLFAVDPH